jgi:hypothetical protein
VAILGCRIGDAIRLYRSKASHPGKTGRTGGFISKIYWRSGTGRKIISIEALLRIAKAVTIPIHEFFRGIPLF